MENKDSIVYLTAGPRGAGKTQYVKKLVEAQPGLHLVERDEVFMRLYQTHHLHPDSPERKHGTLVVARLMRRHLSTKTGRRIILDYYAKSAEERKMIIKNLRQYGAAKIVLLRFITPLSVMYKWFWRKPGLVKLKEKDLRKYPAGTTFVCEKKLVEHFRETEESLLRVDIEGFDEIIYVDPQKPLIALT